MQKTGPTGKWHTHKTRHVLLVSHGFSCCVFELVLFWSMSEKVTYTDTIRWSTSIHHHPKILVNTNPIKFPVYKILCIFKLTYILMDLYGSKHRYVHTRQPSWEGMGTSTMEGIGCFPVRSQGSMMRFTHSPKRFAWRSWASPITGRRAPKWRTWSRSVVVEEPQPPNQKGFGLWGLPFLCCFSSRC